MRTLDYLKDYYNLHGKAIEWGLIVETICFNEEKSETEYRPGLYIRRSSVYVDLLQNRLYSVVNLPEIQRHVHPARRSNIGNGKFRLTAKDNEQMYVELPMSFLSDTHYNRRYGSWMEDSVLL